MTQPLLSICIPTYNRANLLWKTLNSITTQRIFVVTDEIEIVISNNNSDDMTEFVVSEFLKKFPNKIKYIKQTSQILADDNIMCALQNGNGKFLKMHNDTSYIFEDALLKMINDIKIADEKGASAIIFSNGCGKKSEFVDNYNRLLNSVSYFITWIGCCCFKKEYIDSLNNPGRYTYLRLNHVDLIGRLFENGHFLYVSNEQYQRVLIQIKLGGYSGMKIFCYNYFYILENFKKKGLISNKIWNREKAQIILKQILNKNHFTALTHYKIDESEVGFYRFMHYFWLTPVFYLALIKRLYLYIKYILKYRLTKKKRKKYKIIAPDGRQIYSMNNFDNKTSPVENETQEYEYAIGKNTSGKIDVSYSNNKNNILIVGNNVEVQDGVKFVLAQNQSIIIEDNVKLKTGSIICAPVRISKNAIVEEGCVVKEDILENTIALTQPLKYMKIV